jgi:RNA polymerase sigma-70 factor, ECF subfamily
LPEEHLESLFKSWLVEYEAAVLKVARAYTRTVEDCQDLVQEILLQIWRSLPQFQGRASPSTWFYRVALNTALGWKRKENRRQARKVSSIEVEDLAVVGADCARQVAEREVIEQLYAAIRQLPKSDAALVLLYLDDLSYRQMAEVLGISESNVGVKLNRAKHTLGELLHEKCHES